MNCKEYAGHLDAKGLKFGIVVSRFNDLFTGQLLKGALDCLHRHGAAEQDVEVAWVPGSYEQPVVLKKMALSNRYHALISLGAVIQGATTHAGLINAQVARALTQIAMDSGVPVVDGIVAADNLDQAIERCGSKAGNRGWSAAQTAIEMASLLQTLP
jgi:6,7-dimethyl-8-ribityllumazine synthase